MSAPILTTKLYIPRPRLKVVHRKRLINCLNEGLNGKLTLISAPAGSGKTTLLGEWISQCERPIAWVSLDEGDNDPAYFLGYLITALQTVAPNIGQTVLRVLQSPQRPEMETMLTLLLNEIATLPNTVILILDDYHSINAESVNAIITFLLNRLPSQLHLVIATREHPHLPLARLRTHGELTELRGIDLRFSLSETTEFLNGVMGLKLTEESVMALESRTEGWVAGLQLAAISMRDHHDTTSFITSFTGSHRFVLDYLVEEVLLQQPQNIQQFLLHTCILDRLCGSLCDAVLHNTDATGQATLDYLEHANLFIIPLDNERRWYRYHHLFADLLRQRLPLTISPVGDKGQTVDEHHRRASQWYEANGLDIEAFYHATAGHDIDHAERLIEGEGMPLVFRGTMMPVMNWLKSLSESILNTRPSLWVWYAFTCLSLGEATGIEEKLQSAEATLQGIEPDDKIRDIIGRIAAIRSMLAIPKNDIATLLAQSRKALEFLHPNNLPVRTATTWAMGYAYHLQGDKILARDYYTETRAISEASGNIMFNIAATSSLGALQESDNQLHLASETYQRVLQLAGNPPLPHANGAYFGLAQIFYEWNDINRAVEYGLQSLQLGLQIASIDMPASAWAFLARIKLVQGDVDEAIANMAEAERFVREHHFDFRLPELASTRVLILLQQGDIKTATELARTHELSISQVRVYLAQGDTATALALLNQLYKEAEELNEPDKRLKVMVLQAIALFSHGKKEDALHVLADALTIAHPNGFIRTFVDEGLPMKELLSALAVQGIMPDYVNRIQASFDTDKQRQSGFATHQPLIEPLSERELEVLHLIAQGLSNNEIGERLFIALDTVKGYNRRIFDKLQVQRRTEAVARARELGLL